MTKTIQVLAVAATLLITPLANASLVMCTATCILGGAKEDLITVEGKGLDRQDAVSELKKNCDAAAKDAKVTSHYLATSFNKPNANYTTTQTEFDPAKACF